MIELNLGACADCPSIRALNNQRNDIVRTNAAFIEYGLDPRLDEHSSDLFQMAKETGLADIITQITGSQITDSDALLFATRRFIADNADYLDQKEQRLLQETRSCIDNCGGPLKMRAQKAGRTVVAVVCNSPKKTDGPSTEKVTIFRTS
jgi:hypothetical protein